MLRNQWISTWLFLCLLGCFFVLSVAAPRTWRNVARESALEDIPMVTGHTADQVEMPVAPNADMEESKNAWTVAKASSALAAQPLFPEIDNIATEPVPLKFDLVVGSRGSAAADDEPADPKPFGMGRAAEEAEESFPRLAIIPDPSRRGIVLPLDSPPDDWLSVPPKTSSDQNESAVETDIVDEKPLENNEDVEEKTFEPNWPMPAALFEQLDRLKECANTKTWADETRRLMESLVVALSSDTDENDLAEADEGKDGLFERLRRQIAQADRLAGRLKDDCEAEMLRRVNHCLQRRVDLWQLASDIGPAPVDKENRNDMTRLAMVLNEVDSLTGNSQRGAGWREFLLIDALKSLADQRQRSYDGGPAEEAVDKDEATRIAELRRRAIAGEVLSRVARSSLSESQRRFLTQKSLVELGTELRRITDSSFDRRELVRRLELYEASHLPGDARGVADESLRLKMSHDARQRALGEQLAAHYFNPNLRIALTEDILNRLMPKQTAELQPVHDTVLGKPVHGQSLTETDVAIRLIPDPHRLLLALEIRGDVASITNSSSGPATFRNASASQYVARKPMEITATGISLWPAEVAEVRSRTRLQSVQTDYDGIPFIGSFVQGMAKSGHESKRHEVDREIKQKVAVRAKSRIDAEADSRLNKTSERLKTRFIEPLSNLAIEPEMIAAETTAERLVMQLRLASDAQLAAHTHRPWAPLDSLMSLQVHQTAVNNVLCGLNLDGNTFTLAELKERVAEKLNLPKVLDDDTNHDDVRITFAARDAARIDCRDGRIAVTLSIARLEKLPRVWRHFQVRAYYRVELDGLSATLVRDSSIRMVGRRVKTSSQFAIRSIFARVFSKNATVQLVPDRIRENPNMAGQAVTQFDIEDGWVAVALGPRRN